MNKDRITVTLNPSLIKQIDGLIEDKQYSSRSQAIESIINQQLQGKVNQAVILAGGKKTAIKHALTLVAGQPVIVHLINLIQSHGIGQIFIVTDQTSTPLEKIAGQYQQVVLVVQKNAFGTAGSLAHLHHYLLPQPLLVMHGDIFTNINLTDLIRFHQENSSPATMAVQPALNRQQFGTVNMQGHKILNFIHRTDKTGVGMINTGVYILNQQVRDSFAPKKSQMLETDIFPELARHHQLSGYVFDGIWYDVSQPDEKAGK